MSWAETKYAINSSVGTERFKPLDEIINYNTQMIIDSSGDNLLQILDNNGETLSLQKKRKKVRFRTSGKCVFCFSVSSGTSYQLPYYPIVSIYVNGDLKYNYTTAGSNYADVVSADVDFQDGDEITLEYSKSSGDYGKIYNVFVGGYLKHRKVLEEI